MTMTTRSSLLERLRHDGPGAWDEFHRFYSPFLTSVAERLGLRGQDVDDVVQAVFVDFFERCKEFDYDREKGRFRDYLQKILFARLLKMRRQAKRAGLPDENLPEPWDEELERLWEEEYRRHILREALARVRREVEPQTYQAFQLYALEGVEARQVARFLGISSSAVYVYKGRVLAKLKTIVQELLKE